MSLNRFGLNNVSSTGPLTRAAFEETSECLREAAIFGETENVKASITSSVMLGELSQIGTGRFAVKLPMEKNAMNPMHTGNTMNNLNNLNSTRARARNARSAGKLVKTQSMVKMKEFSVPKELVFLCRDQVSFVNRVPWVPPLSVH